jgi:hypothetical protein
MALLLALTACTSPQDREARARIMAHEQPAQQPAPFDWARPEAALSMDADEAAARIGSFDWTAGVIWSLTRGGQQPVRVTERHRVRQLASGEFVVESDLDPEGQLHRADGGKRIVYAGKTTYARSRYAPFEGYRERPTDRGRDARRYREESFGLAGDLARLVGPGLTLTADGEGDVASRKVKKFRLSLADSAAPPGPFASRGRPAPGERAPDEETKRHLAFLDGRVPAKVEGELSADAETGAPLSVKLHASFTVRDDPDAQIDVALDAHVTTLGAAVAQVVAPKEVLPDDRKPRGVARALEAAGLKKKAGEAMGREEPDEEGE